MFRFQLPIAIVSFHFATNVVHLGGPSWIEKKSARLRQRYKLGKQYETRGERKELYGAKDFALGRVEGKQSFHVQRTSTQTLPVLHTHRESMIDPHFGRFVHQIGHDIPNSAIPNSATGRLAVLSPL